MAHRPIRSYQDWLDRTRVARKVRSTRLKKVDKLVKKYFATGTENTVVQNELLRQLKDWMTSKGPSDAWKNSVRNHDNAIADLYRQIFFRPTSQTTYNENLAHSRKGVLYLWSNLQIKDPLFERVLSGGLTIASNSFAFQSESLKCSGKTAGSSLAAMRSTATAQATVAVPNTNRLYGASEQKSRIRRILENFVQSIKDDGVAISASVFKSLIRTMADIFFTSAAHLIKGGLDCIQGLAKACKAAATSIRSWWRSRGVSLVSGHPSVICGSLRRAMKFDFLKGLARAVQGAASAALSSIGAVGGALFNLVVSILEFLGKLVIRYCEVKHLRRFIRECKQQYLQAGSPNSMIHNGARFQEWFSEYVAKHPVIAAITLNSGICGDKMHFLNLFHQDGYTISQADFNHGVRYVDGLKSYASDAIGNWGFRISSTASESEGKMINGLIRNCESFNNPGKLYTILAA